MLYRPELEKDNPVAPQMYVGPRRRLEQARKASLAGAPAQNTTETLRTLTDTAARFVDSLPGSKKPNKHLTALRKAIARAQRLLASVTPDKE